jgi:Xaa-Pro aminopeptidase/Xaa-Pro dipeptidase
MFDYQERMQRLRQAMADWQVDLLFLNPGSDFYYYSGIPTPEYYGEMRMADDWVSGLIVGRDRDPLLLVHGTFASGGTHLEQTWIHDVRTVPWGGDAQEAFGQAWADRYTPGMAIAVGRRVWAQAMVELMEAAPGARFLTATPRMLDQVRAIKDAQELELMRRVARITDVALAETVQRMQPGMSERDIGIEVEHQFAIAGADGVSFEAGIIAVAQGSAHDRGILDRNHDQPIPMGTAIAFDIGGRYEGYCSDFGRTVFMGRPLPRALAAYRCLTQANQRLVAELKGGAMTAEGAAQFVTDWIADQGFGDIHYHPGLGHCIGLEVHEHPWLFPGVTDVLQAGMCFTSEPKIWARGEFYVRVEDVVAVGTDGAESLTKSSYQPLVIE